MRMPTGVQHLLATRACKSAAGQPAGTSCESGRVQRPGLALEVVARMPAGLHLELAGSIPADGQPSRPCHSSSRLLLNGFRVNAGWSPWVLRRFESCRHFGDENSSQDLSRTLNKAALRMPVELQTFNLEVAGSNPAGRKPVAQLDRARRFATSCRRKAPISGRMSMELQVDARERSRVSHRRMRDSRVQAQVRQRRSAGNTVSSLSSPHPF